MNEEETKDTSCIGYIIQMIALVVLVNFFLIPLMAIAMEFWSSIWQECGASLTTCFASVSLW